MNTYDYLKKSVSDKCECPVLTHGYVAQYHDSAVSVTTDGYSMHLCWRDDSATSGDYIEFPKSIDTKHSYPEVTALIPNPLNCDLSIVVNPRTLEQNIKRALVFAKDDHNRVILSIVDDSALVTYGKSNERGNTQAAQACSISHRYQHNGDSYAFDGQLLLDALAGLGDTKDKRIKKADKADDLVTLYFTASNALLIGTLYDRAAVIMPMGDTPGRDHIAKQFKHVTDVKVVPKLNKAKNPKSGLRPSAGPATIKKWGPLTGPLKFQQHSAPYSRCEVDKKLDCVDCGTTIIKGITGQQIRYGVHKAYQCALCERSIQQGAIVAFEYKPFGGSRYTLTGTLEKLTNWAASVRLDMPVTNGYRVTRKAGQLFVISATQLRVFEGWHTESEPCPIDTGLSHDVPPGHAGYIDNGKRHLWEREKGATLPVGAIVSVNRTEYTVTSDMPHYSLIWRVLDCVDSSGNPQTVKYGNIGRLILPTPPTNTNFNRHWDTLIVPISQPYPLPQFPTYNMESANKEIDSTARPHEEEHKLTDESEDEMTENPMLLDRNKLRHPAELRQQELNAVIVEQNIIANHSSMIEDVLKIATLDWHTASQLDTPTSDDIENAYAIREFSDLKYEFEDEYADWLEYEFEDDYHDWMDLSGDEQDNFGSFADWLKLQGATIPTDDTFGDWLQDERRETVTEPQEIYEWWQVTGYLYRQLLANGEPVLNCNYGYFWGRTTTGQAIKLDGVITNIQREAEYSGVNEYALSDACYLALQALADDDNLQQTISEAVYNPLRTLGAVNRLDTSDDGLIIAELTPEGIDLWHKLLNCCQPDDTPNEAEHKAEPEREANTDDLPLDIQNKLVELVDNEDYSGSVSYRQYTQLLAAGWIEHAPGTHIEGITVTLTIKGIHKARNIQAERKQS